MLNLPELRRLLLDAETPADVKDACWVQLLRALRDDWNVWVQACLWLALPGLRRQSRSLRRQLSLDEFGAEDVDSELLTGFLIELQAASAREGDGVRVLGRMLDAAGRHVLRSMNMRGWQEDGLPPLEDRGASAVGHPELLLWRAVGAGVICAQDSELIARTRLERRSLGEEAEQAGVSLASVSARRRRAELAVAKAIRGGDLEALR